jgi:transcriptional regulator with XRE-family HTH domain
MAKPRNRNATRLLRLKRPSPLRILRVARGFTQAELARECGISTGLLSHFERGQRDLSGETLGQLASLLDCSIDVLETGRVRVGRNGAAVYLDQTKPSATRNRLLEGRSVATNQK